jgi:multidrug efflux pump subunit AcrA (membrane-fusion protein)
LHARWLRRWKIVVPVTLVVVAAAAGTSAWALNGPSSDPSSVTYRTTTASTGTIRQSVSASGTIAAESTQDLSFGASGEVTDVYVTVGQKVTKGQKLAAMSSASLVSAVAQAKASLADAKARLASDEDADASSTQITADNASVDLAEAQLADAETALAGATLTSPIAGTVTQVNVTVGQQVAGGSGSSGNGGTGTGNTGQSGSNGSTGSTGSTSTAAIQVISTGSYVVNATVDATDVGLIKKGNQVVIVPSGSTANVFGLVSSVGIVASSSSGVATFPVVVDVTGSPAGLYAGATASLQIVYRQLSDVMTVPTLAVSRESGSTYVLVPSGSSSKKQVVETGLSSGGQTQVVSGLKEGDQVLVAVPQGNNGTTGGRNGNGNGNRFGGGGFGGGGFAPPGGANGTTFNGGSR